ncbi:MAG TPA: L,D-transpeptidase [Actinomycetes bacterium]|nr:L,D-transpeptidase [Actinomycetes bacterium]
MTIARLPRLIAPACLAVLLVAGCSKRSATPADPAAPGAAVPTPVAPTTTAPPSLGDAPAYAALARGDTVIVRAQPGAGKPADLIPPKLVWGTPTPFLVREVRRVGGDLWYRVMLPKRPNESSGWVRGDQVRTVPRQYRAKVDLSERRLSLYQGDQLVRTFPVGIGRPSTPTPAGRFFVTVRLRPPQVSTVYGAWALGLSGYSRVLAQFGTGDGQIALHGTSNPANLGHQVSNGCVRLDNAAVSMLAKLLEPGSPVDIAA